MEGGEGIAFCFQSKKLPVAALPKFAYPATLPVAASPKITRAATIF